MTDSGKQEEVKFFHSISPKILNLVSEKFKKSSVIKYKVSEENTHNFVTEADVAVENTVVEEIKDRFPEDRIVAEENYADVKVTNKGRFWIIDPICGTSNFAKELRLFVTNIALAEDGELVAACAIDHAQGDYIWSVGDQKIFINDTEANLDRKSSGTTIEVDLGGAMTSSKERKEQFSKFLSRIIQETNYIPLTYNSSLGFSYVAIGRIDAYVSADNKIWDVAAPNFLAMAAGGIVTKFDGTPWTLDSSDVLAVRGRELHKELLGFLNS